MAGTFTVLMDEEEFCIMGPDGTTGEQVSYDEVATLIEGKEVYICRVDDPDAPTQSVERVTQTALMPTEIEEVDFEEEDDKDEDDDGGGDDDGEQIGKVERVIVEDDAA